MSRPAPGALRDERAREIATREFGLNLVVTAGAGTGKTALLVGRALNMIGSGIATIDRLAAVTFTEKAAAELRQRLGRGLDGLWRRASSSATDAAVDARRDADRSWAFMVERGEDPLLVRRRALAALNGLDGAAIGTIHGLCADILRRYPAEAGVDPSFVVDEGPAAEREFRAESERFLRAELGASAPRPDIWRRALGRCEGLGTVLELAERLSAFSLPLEAGEAGAGDGALELVLAEAGEALAGVRGILGRASGLAPKMDAVLRSADTLLEALVRGGLGALRAATPALALDVFAGTIALNAGRRATGADPEAIESAAARACRLLRLLARVDGEGVTALTRAARPLGASARERLLSAGFVSFDGLLRLTADLLRRSPAVRRALSRRYARLLVDEFQDTDPLQYDILFFLAEEEGGRATDPYRTRLQAGRLFIVGDPKQSIYRFRGADISSFRRAVEHVKTCGGREISLTTSFRSPEDLLAPINTLFAGWMGGAGGWQGDYEPPYEPIVSARPEARPGRPRVEIWSVESEGGADAGRAAEAESIAAWIAAWGAVGGEGHAFRDVALLLRALTNAGLYARALRRAGIPFVVDGGKEFHVRAEVGDLIAFLRAVASPNDGPAMLAVLRSPLGGVSDVELARFAAAGGRLDRRVGLPDMREFPGVDRAFTMVDGFRDRMRARPADVLIQEALVNPPLALLHASAWDGAQRLANLAKLVGLARRHAREGLSLPETLTALEEGFAGSRTEGESPLADESLDAVRILSIHKAKGLEFPIVFVPDVGRDAGGERRPPETRVAWVDEGGGHLAVLLPDGRCNTAWVRHALETRKHEEAEEKRVFYVACTRARERLVLVNSTFKGAAPWRERLQILGYRMAEGPAFPPPGALADGLVEHRVVRPAPAAGPAAATPLLDSIVRAAAAHRHATDPAALAARPPISWPSGTRRQDRSEPDETADARTAATSGAGRGEIARVAGLAVHAALEGWDFLDDDLLLERARREARRLSTETGDDPTVATEPARAAAVADEILRGFLRSGLRARLAAAEILGREMPVLQRDATGRTWTGAIDLLFREAGVLVVADYKTDEIRGSTAEAAAKYGEQIDVYVRAVRAAFPRERVEGEILFLRTGDAVRR